MARKKKTEKVDLWSGEGVKLKYDPMLLGPNDEISDGMAEYIKNEAPEYMDLLRNREKDLFAKAGCEFVDLDNTDYTENEEPVILSEEDAAFFDNVPDLDAESNLWDDSIEGLDDFSDSELESMGGLSIEFDKEEDNDEEWWNDLDNSGLNGIGGLDNFGGRDICGICDDWNDWNDWDELDEEWHNNMDELGDYVADLENAREINREYFDNVADSQIRNAIEDAKEALSRLKYALSDMHSGAVLGGFDKATCSLNNFKRIYAGWVYEEMFSERHAVNSVNLLFEQFHYEFLRLVPHIEAVLNDEDMVLCQVSNCSVVFEEYDDEDYLELSSLRCELNPRYVPLEWAKENARICPECGSWVDNELDRCSCNYIFPLTEEQERGINGDFFDIEMDMEGIDHETVSRVLGGDDFGYCENYQGEEIHFFGGGMGCTTTVNMPESPTGLGADDYAFIVLQDNGYRIYHEQIQDALMEINDNNEEVVNETFYRFFKALYELKGWDYVIDIVQDLIKDDVVYINAALDKTVNWLRENGFVEDYVNEHFNPYVELKHTNEDIEDNDEVVDYGRAFGVDLRELEKDKVFTLAVSPDEIKIILEKTIDSIGRMAKMSDVKDLIRVDDKPVVSYTFQDNTVIYTDSTLECILGGQHYIFIEIVHNNIGFSNLKVNLSVLSDAYARNDDVIEHMLLMFYKGLVEAKDVIFANELFAHICSKTTSVMTAACCLVFREHNAPVFIDLYPTAFNCKTIVEANANPFSDTFESVEDYNNYPRIEFDNVILDFDGMKLMLPEELRKPYKDYLNLAYSVVNDLGNSVIFNLYEGLVLRPTETKAAVTKYCELCSEAFDMNEMYFHKHFAEHLKMQIAFGLFYRFTEFMTDEDAEMFENYIKYLVEIGIEDEDLAQEYIKSVKEIMSK